MRFFKQFRQASNSNVADASDDIASVEIKTSPVPVSEPVQVSENNTKAEELLIDDMPADLLLLIGQYLDLIHVYNFSLCNSKLLKLYFNLERRQLTNANEIERNYENDENDLEFTRVQTLIWKSLAISYFPKLEKSMNVKNWMHLLRRRLKHLKINGSSFKLDIPSFVNSNHDEEMIENCEWVYKCPLRFQDLSGLGDVKFCNVCDKHVYLVYSMDTFKDYVRSGHCVAFTQKLSILDELEPIMGACVEYNPYDDFSLIIDDDNNNQM